MTPQNFPQRRFGEIALCLSGGGYRAAAFALGTLDMLDELELLQDVKLLSTVSGGTFTGVAYALAESRNQPFKDFYDEFGKFLLETNAIDNSLDDLYRTPAPPYASDLSLIRSAAWSYSKCYFGERRFEELRGTVSANGRFRELIFNATEFRTGNSFRFRESSSEKKVFFGSQIFSVPDHIAGETLLADIVAASSCFPGVFEPFRFPDDFRWQSSIDFVREELKKDVHNPKADPPIYRNGFNVDGECISIPLMDGGVFDNQGTTSAVLADEIEGKGTKIYDLFLIADTTQRDNDILRQSAVNRRGFLGFNLILWLVGAVFAVSLSGIAALAYMLFGGKAGTFTKVELAVPFAVAVLPVLGLALGLLLIYFRMPNLRKLEIAGDEYDVWETIKRLTVPDAFRLGKVRANSVLAMTTNVFLKRIRQLQFNLIMQADAARAKRVSFDLIYDLKPTTDRDELWKLDPDLRPTPAMEDIARDAEQMSTKLSINAPLLRTLIACGRCTTCFSLLKYLWRRWESDQTAPKPNEPNSPYFEIYTQLKTKWRALRLDPYSGQNRDRA